MANPKAAGKKHSSRNYSIHKSGAIKKFSRAVLFRKKMLYKKKFSESKMERKPVDKKKTSVEMKVKKMNGTKNGAERKVPVNRTPRLYATQGKRAKIGKAKSTVAKKIRIPKLRDSIKPGTVLILLAGHQKGKHVVFLKQLSSGLLLVTGPYRVNGCPLRRVGPTYVIATKTRLDISGVKLPETLNDAYFKRAQSEKRTKKEAGDIFAKTKETYKATEQRKKDQTDVDKMVLAAIKKHAEGKYLREYLKTSFSLRNKQFPHNMVF